MSAPVLRIDRSPNFRGGRLSQQDPLNFGEFLQEYDAGYIANLAVSTQAKYRAHLKNHISPAFGTLSLCAVTTRLLDQWLVQKKNAGLSSATRSDLRSIIASIYRVAKKWEVWKGDNPAQLASVGRKRAAREKRKLTPEQIRAILEILPADVRVIVMVALFCTLRISEILGLQWRHINFKTGVIEVRQRYYRGDLDETKTEGSVRDVPMGELAAHLTAMRPADATAEHFVFRVRTRYGFTRDASNINLCFLRPAAEKLGVYYEGFGFHAFRREAITGLAAEADPIQAMRAAGHTRMDTTLLYGLSDLDRQEAAIRRLQQKILRKGAA